MLNWQPRFVGVFAMLLGVVVAPVAAQAPITQDKYVKGPTSSQPTQVLTGTLVGKSTPAQPSPPPVLTSAFADLPSGAAPSPPLGNSASPMHQFGTLDNALPFPTPATTTPSPAADAIDYTPKLKFKPGDEHLLHVEMANGLFKFYVGGRLQIDGTWLRASDAVQAPRAVGGIDHANDAVNFRRARFDFGGTFYRNIDFLMEWDFINTVNVERTGAPLPVNTPVPTDMWVNFRNVPYFGNVRVGNQKPPISFEHMTSSRFLNFLERSLAFDAFVENQNNGFEPGIAAFDTMYDERATWAIGVFKNTRNIFGWNTGDGEYDVTGRVTALPIYENDGAQLVHVGIGASHRDLDDDFDRMRARLMVRDGPAILHNIVAEARLRGDSRDQVVPEFVVVWGPWSLQSEYYSVWVNNAEIPVDATPRTKVGTAHFQGAYAELLYFLTGEHRHYDKHRAAFGRVTPHQNFTGFGMTEAECSDCGHEVGLGAWQLGIRYQWLDLDYKQVRGSTCHDVTAGLNWFLNPYMKWQFNYTALYRDAPNPVHDGWVYGFGVRLALDF